MKNELQRMKKAIFSGLSYMIPLVAGSGLLMAIGVILSMALGYDPSGSDFAWSIDGNNLEQLINCRFDQLIWWTGKFGLNLMAPFLAAYVSNSIAGKPGLAPGIVIGWMASVMNGSFIGGIVAGLLTGYIANFIKTHVKLKGAFQSLLSFSIIPLFTLAISAIIYRYSIGLLINEIMSAMTNGLTYMNGQPELRILLGAILGAMMCADFGGPINKTAVLFVYGVYAETMLPSTYAHIALNLPMTAILSVMLLNKKYFNEAGRNNSISNFILGCFGIGENTIPFAMAHPTVIIPPMIIGGAVASGLAALFNCEVIPTLSFFMAVPFVAAVDGMNAVLMYALAYFAGVAVAVVLTTLMLRLRYRQPQVVWFDDDEAGFDI